MQDDCFTIFCRFLPHTNVNQPWVCVRPLPLEPPSHLPPQPTPLSCHRALDLNSLRYTALEGPVERAWQPTPVFLPGKSHGRRSLVGYSPWGRKESDMTERVTHTHTHRHTHPWGTILIKTSIGLLTPKSKQRYLQMLGNNSFANAS